MGTDVIYTTTNKTDDYVGTNQPMPVYTSRVKVVEYKPNCKVDIYKGRIK